MPFVPGGVGRALAQSNAIGGDAALKRLIDGNARYVAGTYDPKDFDAGRAARATAQYPIVGVLSCADSRVAPEFVFDQGPGEVFVVRIAGNFVDDDGLASLEYGVAFLGVPLLMVLGHTNCGAVGAAIKVVKENADLPGHLPGLVTAIKPAVVAAISTNPPDLLQAAIVENVRLNVLRLANATPVISTAVTEGKVKVVGALYDLPTGKVSLVS